MKISAIICTSNRPTGLNKLLRALAGQDRLPDQILIIEDRDGPEPTQLLDALRAKGVDVCYLRRSPPGLTASRNLALANASGDLLSFFDDDTVPAADYLRMTEQVFDADVSGQLGGLAPVFEPWDHRPGLGDRLWQFFHRLAGLWSLPYRRRRQIFPADLRSSFALFDASHLPGVVTYRASALASLSFDENLPGYGLGEDLDISFSLSARWQLYRCALLRIHHQRDPHHRPNNFAMGKMFTRNLAHITCKHAGCRIGTVIVLIWQFLVLCLARSLFFLLGDHRRHLRSLSGMLAALPRTLRDSHATFGLAPRPSDSAAIHHHPRRRKHILFVLNTLAPGGAERLTLALSQHLDSKCFKSSILCLQQPGSLAESLPNSLDFYHDLSSGKFDPLVLPSMVHLIASRRVDLVVSVGSGGDRMFFSSLACLITRRPLVVWCHAQPTSAAPTFERLNRLLRCVTHTFVAVSTDQAQALKKILHIPPARIKLIENALPDLPPARAKKATAQQRARFRRGLDLPAKSFLIAVVANLRPVKGHDVLIDAAAEVLRQHKNAYFLLVGQGPQHHAITERINRLGIDPKHIVFLGQRSDVPDLLRHCDLLVSPSHSESFGLAVLEAMAAGLPVIATDCPGPKSLIDNDRTGLLTPVGQPHPLAQAILSLIEDPERRDRLAAQAQLFARGERFHISTMTRAFENLFELLV